MISKAIFNDLKWYERPKLLEIHVWKVKHDALGTVYHWSMTRKTNTVNWEWVNCRCADSPCKYSQQGSLIINIMTH